MHRHARIAKEGTTHHSLIDHAPRAVSALALAAIVLIPSASPTGSADHAEASDIAEVLGGSAASLCARVSVWRGKQRMADWRGRRSDRKNVHPSSAGGILRMRTSAVTKRAAIRPVVVRERRLRDPVHA
jgi:hypothetical protein